LCSLYTLKPVLSILKDGALFNKKKSLSAEAVKKVLAIDTTHGPPWFSSHYTFKRL
jgi:hypothetical protein